MPLHLRKIYSLLNNWYWQYHTATYIMWFPMKMMKHENTDYDNGGNDNDSDNDHG